LFARFFTSKRRLALGFLNHQQKWDSSTQTLFFSGWPEKKLTIAEGNSPQKTTMNFLQGLVDAYPLKHHERKQMMDSQMVFLSVII